jgi:hypothetical protein
MNANLGRKEGKMPRQVLKKRYLLAVQLMLLVVALANSGCLLATAGVAGGAVVGYAYCKGRVCETYNANCDDTWAATHTALVELGMPIVKEERKKSEGFIESRTADGDRVRIYMENETSRIPAEGQICRVSVRVAAFGDRPVSDRILDQVGAHLAPAALPGVPPPSPIVAGGVIQTGGSQSSSFPAGLPFQTAPPPLLPPEPTPLQMQTPR